MYGGVQLVGEGVHLLREQLGCARQTRTPRGDPTEFAASTEQHTLLITPAPRTSIRIEATTFWPRAWHPSG